MKKVIHHSTYRPSRLKTFVFLVLFSVNAVFFGLYLNFFSETLRFGVARPRLEEEKARLEAELAVLEARQLASSGSSLLERATGQGFVVTRPVYVSRPSLGSLVTARHGI